jgi:hypothetical protein
LISAEGTILNVFYARWRLHIMGAARGESIAVCISGKKIRSEIKE